ncbi:efflux RND transporter permease subunit [Paraferrimonas sp. SM1919]|uniref:efflux RND transporter permease subunit n=1 Tax=Paraferrimonas sp. SM1919 TaxID=2662263 RepID=UPI0013D0A3FB|nr:efflux RND transporter permease subunit [Paraferrimonas sp. SM1919]
MPNITALALKRPVTTFMLFISLLLLGAASSRLLPLEMFPGIDIPRVFVQVPYQGSTPAEVERDITLILEESLATLSGIDEMHSESNQDGVQIWMNLKWGENIASKALQARERIDSVRHLLPADLERIFVMQFSTSDMSILTLRLSSERELANAYDLLDKQLKRPLERVPGVSKVELYGVEQKRIEVRLDANKVMAANLSIAELRGKLLAQNFIQNGGQLRSTSGVLQVLPQGEFKNLEQIKALPISDGLTLGDISEVLYSLPEKREGRHLDQTYAVGLNIFKESGANLVEVANRVLKVVNEVENNPQFDGINLYVMEDQADAVERSLSDLLLAGLLGALLSFIVLYLFLRNLMMTAIIVTSVPVSIAITLGAMYMLGYTLNILSMMGLLLAVGMLIDNAVVVTESVLQEQAKKTPQPILTGVNKVTLAVIAGTLTTAIVFLPNIVGVKVELTVFLEHVAMSICISLAASLLVAKTLIPLMLHKINVKHTQKVDSKLQRFYIKSLSWSLNHPKVSAFIAVLMLASTALPLSMVGEGSDNNDKDRLYINYNIEGRHSLAVSEALVSQMEQYLYDNKQEFGIESIYSYYHPERATSTLIMNKELPDDIEKLKEKMKQGFPKFSIAKPQFGWGGNNSGVRLTLTGPATSELVRISQQLIPLLSAVEGLTDVNSELTGSQQELIIEINRELVNRLGTDVATVSQNIATAMRGTPLRSFRHDPSGEIRFELAMDYQYRQSLEAMENMPILRVNNRVYRLADIATTKLQPRLEKIRHFNRQTSLTLGANLEKDFSMDKAREALKQALDQIHFKEGYGYRFGGGFERNDESQGIMVTNMLLAICLIYIVMAAVFESLLMPTAIITSILFSITGVFWALFITGTGMSVMAMIGILILMGIVVNNGIVLVEHIGNPKSDEPLLDIIVSTCQSRLRPVLMTVGTTVVGLIPLALGDTQVGGGGPPYGPMAIAIIGGLVFSTFTSLYLVPLCYLGLYRLREASARGLGNALRFNDKYLAKLK